MRTVVLCATLAAVILPFNAGAQSLPLTEAEALARLSPASPRVRAIARRYRRGPRRCAGGRPLAQSARHVRSGGGRGRHREHGDGQPGASDHRASRIRGSGSVGPGRCQFQPRRRRRCGARAPISVWPSRNWRPPRCASGSWRHHATVCADWPTSSPNGKPQEMRPDSIAFGLNARWSTSTPTAPPPPRTALGRRRRWRDSSSMPSIRPVIVAVDASTMPPALPPVDALVEQAESTRGELLALRKEIDAARLSLRADRSASCARTRSRGRHQVVDGRRWGHGQRDHGARLVAAVRSQPSRTGVGRRSGETGRGSYRTRFVSRCEPRSPRSASR